MTTTTPAISATRRRAFLGRAARVLAADPLPEEGANVSHSSAISCSPFARSRVD